MPHDHTPATHPALPRRFRLLLYLVLTTAGRRTIVVWSRLVFTPALTMKQNEMNVRIRLNPDVYFVHERRFIPSTFLCSSQTALLMIIHSVRQDWQSPGVRMDLWSERKFTKLNLLGWSRTPWHQNQSSHGWDWTGLVQPRRHTPRTTHKRDF